jgi:hypothetical protein
VEWGVAKEVFGINVDSPGLEVVASCVRCSAASPMQRRTFLFVTRLNREPLLFEVGQTESLVSLGGHMEHIDALVSLYSEVGFVAHQQFNQLHVSVERREVQRVKSLLGQRGRVYPIGHVFANLLLYVGYHVCV